MLGQQAEFVWHKETDLNGADAVILPGGFSHGDYLRTGAIARFSPVMAAVNTFASAGGPVLGICNGFQILLEAGLLPGAMLRNRELKFRCEHVYVRVEQTDTPFTQACARIRCCGFPSRTAKENFTTPDELRAPKKNGVVFRYVISGAVRTRRPTVSESMRHLQRIAQCRRPDAHPERGVRMAVGRMLGGALRVGHQSPAGGE